MQVNLLTLQVQFTIAALLALILRQCMKRLPKIYSYALWILVFGRLLCPFSFETKHAVMPDAGRVNQFVAQVSGENMIQLVPAQQDIKQMETFLSGDMPQKNKEMTAVQFKNIARGIFPILWCLGTVLILGINILALLRIYRKIRGAEQVEQNVFVSTNIKTPFTFGIFRPQIFLPVDIEKKERTYVLCHEQVHICRKDYIVKGIAFLLTALYWFNPCVWVAFHFLEQDMEMSCDEAVIRRLGNDVRRQYSQSLLDFAAGKKRRACAPLAFGEVSVKQRIKNVLSKKSTKKYIGTVGVLALCAVAVIIFTVGSGNIVSADITENPAQADGNQDAGEPVFKDHEESDTLAYVKDSTFIELNENALAETNSSEENVPADKKASSIVYGADEQAELTAAQRFVTEWAKAFCDRNGNFIAENINAAVQKGFMDNELLSKENGAYSFGLSSPWPWGDAYLIRNLDENQATILYYAQTSEPHVTVWMERITFEKTDQTYQVTEEELDYMDSISSHYEFCMAYPAGVIEGTPMDYSAEDTLIQTLITSAKAMGQYEILLQPETAAVYLLNLSDDKDKVQVSAQEKEGKMVVSFYFSEEKKTYDFVMVQAKDTSGAAIWIPQGALTH